MNPHGLGGWIARIAVTMLTGLVAMPALGQDRGVGPPLPPPRPVAPKKADNSLHIAPIAVLGFGDGIGAGVYMRSGQTGIQVTGALSPTLVTVDARKPLESEIHVEPAWQFNALAFTMPWQFTRVWSLGLMGGYRFNELLGHGLTFAVVTEVMVRDTVRLFITLPATVNYHWQADSRVRRHFNLRGDQEVNWPIGAEITGGIGIGVTY